MRWPFPVLVADIGGTNARFALLTAPDAALSPVVRLATGDHAGFAEAVEAAVAAQRWPRPQSVLIGAAGAVHARSVHLTNADWQIDGPALADRLGLAQGMLLNDFETLALALPALQPGDLSPIGGGCVRPGVRLVIGPGTGLGVGALVEAGDRLLPLSSEGGHIALATAGDAERRLLDTLTPGGGRLPAEVLLAGPGLGRLMQALAPGRPAADYAPAAILAAAGAGQDPAAVQAVGLWLRFLARFCGDMALTFMASGGVFLAGGILPRLGPLINAAVFRQAFADNATHRSLLETIPVRLIKGPDPALTGLAALARTPQRYHLDYAGRLWR